MAALPELPTTPGTTRAAAFIAQMRLYGGYFLPQGPSSATSCCCAGRRSTCSPRPAARCSRTRRCCFPAPSTSAGLLAALPDLPAGYLELSDELLVPPDTGGSGAA